MRSFFVYIMANRRRTVLYVGVTGNLLGRARQHKDHYDPDSFTARYNVGRLVYYEEYAYVWDAIAREKQLKAGSRKRKMALIERQNPQWKDLSATWYGRTRRGDSR